MTKFRITAVRPETGVETRMIYDTSDSSLVYESSGSRAVELLKTEPVEDAPITSRTNPAGKQSPRVLKISLGLSCNYSCEYCSQRFVPHATETNPGDVDAFISGLDAWVLSPPERVEFWGGEPFVYIKTMRPLAEAIRRKYPEARLSVITNGSLLSAEINEWLDRLGFIVSISHDGPGQSVRGPDPLADSAQREAILDLYRRLAPSGRFSFNSMLNRANQSRAAIQKFFIDLTGDPRIMIGEGGFVDAYDEGGLGMSLRPDEDGAFRRRAFAEIRSGAAANISGARDRVASFVNSIRVGRKASTLGQKCGMDSADNIAVDLMGNVLTCQNVSAASIAPNGESHRLGNVADMSSVALRTATHWAHRDECVVCPMLQICKGACMFLEGPLWEASCNNAFADAVPIFAAGIEFLTGLVPVRIDGPHRADRQDLWQAAGPSRPARRVIPINAVETERSLA